MLVPIKVFLQHIRSVYSSHFIKKKIQLISFNLFIRECTCSVKKLVQSYCTLRLADKGYLGKDFVEMACACFINEVSTHIRKTP